MGRTRLAAIVAGSFGAASLMLAIVRVAVLSSSSGLIAVAGGFAFVALIALAAYLQFRATEKKTAGLMDEYVRVSARAAPGDVVLAGWFWDGADGLAGFSGVDAFPTRMITHASSEGFDFLSESDEVVAHVPWPAVKSISSSFRTGGSPIPVAVIMVATAANVVTIYPGAPRRKGSGFGWLNGSALTMALDRLEAIRTNASASR